MSRKGVIFGILGGVIVLGLWIFSNRGQVEKFSRNHRASVATAITPAPAPVETFSPTPTPVLPKAALNLAPKDLRKMVVLQEIMVTKNEADPRIEKDLLSLSPAVKSVAEGLYTETPVDHDRERAIIVLVIGRQLTQKADIDFLKEVLLEKPLNANSVYYPQTVAIRSLIEQYRRLRGDPLADKTLAPHILDVLHLAEHAPNARVVSDAEDAINYLTRRK